MPALRLTKHHGQGNDFLVLLDPDERQPLDPDTVRFLCHRRRGVGADGVIRVTRADPGDDGATLAMELRNADGSAAEMSGNGVRCLAQAAVDAGLASSPTFIVRTVAGPRTVTVQSGEDAGTAEVSVDMGAAELGADEPDPTVAAMLPERGWRARTVCVGNPHLVLLGTDLGGVDVSRAGTAAQQAYPGHRFELAEGPDAHNDRVRFTWHLHGPDGNGPVAVGIDFGTVAGDGRLRTVTGFLEPQG